MGEAREWPDQEKANINCLEKNLDREKRVTIKGPFLGWQGKGANDLGRGQPKGSGVKGKEAGWVTKPRVGEESLRNVTLVEIYKSQWGGVEGGCRPGRVGEKNCHDIPLNERREKRERRKIRKAWKTGHRKKKPAKV